MQTYVVRRVLLAIPTLIGISVLIFVVMRVLPGDPISVLLGGETNRILSPEQVQLARMSLGLDRPLYVQYLSWMGDVLRGDLGRSFWREEPVRVLILRRAPITIEIATLAVLISWSIGIPVGVLSALKRESKLDYVVRAVTMLFVAIPSFWLAMLILMFTVLNFLWRPPIEMVYLWENPWSNLQMVAGPAGVLGLGLAAVIARFSRSSMLEVLGQDYVRTARAKGLFDRQVIWPHALKNAFLPILTATGGAFGGLLGGAVAVETAFLVPGLGNALVAALSQRDWIVIQNLVLLYGVIHTVINLIVDLSYRWIDPRIRYV